MKMKFTKLETRLMIIVMLLSVVIISGFRMISGYIVMEPWETIKVVCLTSPFVDVSGPKKVIYNGKLYYFSEIFCPRYFVDR